MTHCVCLLTLTLTLTLGDSLCVSAMQHARPSNRITISVTVVVMRLAPPTVPQWLCVICDPCWQRQMQHCVLVCRQIDLLTDWQFLTLAATTAASLLDTISKIYLPKFSDTYSPQHLAARCAMACWHLKTETYIHLYIHLYNTYTCTYTCKYTCTFDKINNNTALLTDCYIG